MDTSRPFHQDAVVVVILHCQLAQRKVVARRHKAVGQLELAVENRPLALFVGNALDGQIADVHGDRFVVGAVGDQHGVARLGAVDGRLDRLAVLDRDSCRIVGRCCLAAAAAVDGKRLCTRRVFEALHHWQTRWNRFRQRGQAPLVGQCIKERHQIGPLLVVEIEAVDEHIHVVDAEGVPAAVGVEVDHILQCCQRSVVHIRRGQCDVA